MPGFFRQQITRRWNEFLENKYATNDTLRAGWGPLAAALSIGEIPLPTQRIQPTQVLLPSPVYADLIAFGMERWQKHTAACTALFRSLAPKGIGSNVAPLCAGATPNPVLPMAYASALGDFVAANDYHYMLSADPRNPLSPWRSRLMEPPVLHAGLGLAVADKPFVIYEGNVHKPAPYRAEYPLFDALAACWQDYDGVFMHALGALKPRDDEPWTEPLTYAFNGPWKTLFDGCLAWTDEIQCAGFRTAGEIYRQGLVAPAPRPATVTIGRRAIYGPEYYRYGRGLWDERQALPSLEWTQTVHGGRILYDPTWDGTVKTQGQIAAQPTTAVTWGRGPEVRWDWPRGQVVVDTPGCSALAGFGWRNHRFSTGVAISGLNRPYVSITLASQDGAPISSSRRLICSCLSTGENTGLRVDATKMKSFALQGGRRYVHGAESLQAMVVDPGTAPVRIQRVTCTVSLPRLPGRVCRKLDFSLKCIAEQPAETGFTLTETEPVFVCQLVAP